jgi:hypothetical protein
MVVDVGGIAGSALISAEVATADGQLVTASAQENEDLFCGEAAGPGCRHGPHRLVARPTSMLLGW